MINFYIHEWENGQATLMTENGVSVFTFSDIAIAERTCREWYQYNLADSNSGHYIEQDISFII